MANKKYPFKKLKVGQSFFVPGKSAKELPVWYWSNRLPGIKFIARSLVENDIYGTRVWRIQ
jgi:hypothetical protein|tara:strand:- start:1859 stop:2041 length:183 start_codon:yes stop_codon:yes gene_type:complete